MIAADIFAKIGIPLNRKAFLMVRSDNAGTRKAVADYTLPFGDERSVESLIIWTLSQFSIYSIHSFYMGSIQPDKPTVHF
jgi:hypothetical protein